MSLSLTIPVIETERLILRPPNGSDCAAMQAFFAEDRSQFYGGPLDKGEAWRRFATYAGQWLLRGYGFFAVELKETGQTVGLVGPFHPADFDEPEMSWLICDAEQEGKGFAREACQAVLEHLFSDLGWSSVVSFIDRDNAASRGLALRLGAQLDPDTRSPLPGCEVYRHFPEGG